MKNLLLLVPLALLTAAAIRFDALKHGLTDLRDQLKAVVVEIGGEDPWGDTSDGDPVT